MQRDLNKNKKYYQLLDQLFEIERKLDKVKEVNSIARNVNKMKDIFENFTSNASLSGEGFTYHNPIGEKYNETRLDLEASIAGDSTENLFVVEVIKPIIRLKTGRSTIIARKGVVVVTSNKTN